LIHAKDIFGFFFIIAQLLKISIFRSFEKNFFCKKQSLGFLQLFLKVLKKNYIFILLEENKIFSSNLSFRSMQIMK